METTANSRKSASHLRHLQESSNDGIAAPVLPCEMDFGDLADSLASIYLRSLNRWLRTSPYQTVIASVSLLVGLFCLWDGDRFWMKLFTVACMAGAASVARYESKIMKLDVFSEVMLMAQAAFAL